MSDALCELANWIAIGITRHYCENAATRTVTIDGENYGACEACYAELAPSIESTVRT